MSLRRVIILLLALLLLAPPVAPLGLASGDEPLPKWGFYIYMAGDNSLSNEAADDLIEMQIVASTSRPVSDLLGC